MTEVLELMKTNRSPHQDLLPWHPEESVNKADKRAKRAIIYPKFRLRVSDHGSNRTLWWFLTTFCTSNLRDTTSVDFVYGKDCFTNFKMVTIKYLRTIRFKRVIIFESKLHQLEGDKNHTMWHIAQVVAEWIRQWISDSW